MTSPYERPEFIPQDMFRSYMSRGKLNKLFTIGGMKPTTFLTKFPAKPIMIKGIKSYRPIDFLARAKARGMHLAPLAENTAKGTIKELQAEIATLEAALKGRKHLAEMSHLSKALTGHTLLLAEEILEASHSYQPECGIYFLIKANKLIYVGQSINIPARLATHKTTYDFDHYAYVLCSQDKLDIYESLYIHFLRPSMNGKSRAGKLSNLYVFAPLTLEKLFNSIVGKK